MQKAMASAMQNMAPMMVKMTESTAEALLEVGARPESARLVAAFKRNLFDELVKTDFTRSEALQITASASMPTMRC